MSVGIAQTQAYVISASVASELHSLTGIAKQVSMIAKNARALAIRAGETVSGFRAITGFIEEIAQFSSDRGSSIDSLATAVSRITVTLLRMDDARKRFNRAAGNGQQHVSSLDEGIALLESNFEETSKQYRRSVRRLKMEIEEIGGQLRGIQLMVSSSRVEAAGAGDFKEGLNSVATQLENAYENMYSHIFKARTMINYIPMEQL